MDSNMTYTSSDKLLEQIFDITQRLYWEMSEADGIVKADHNNIYRLLTDLGKVLVNADRASFWKWDKRTRSLWTTAAVGTDKISIPEGTGLVGRALAEGHAIVTNDPYNHPDFNSEVDKKTGYVTKSILVMPIANCKGEFIGAYRAINKLGGKGGFDLEEDVKRLSLAAFICGITLESDSFLEDSHHDKLTELKNRMGFYSDYDNIYSPIFSDKEECHNISMFICDIDFFKKINDTYGHNAGDAVLKNVAEIFRRNARAFDEVYRWGGEEFIMVLPKTSAKQAAEAAERLRIAVMESVCHFEELDIKITMSFGVTQLDPLKTIEENIKVADEKLYKAKESGRNRVIL